MGQETTPTTELTEPVEALLEAARYDDFEDVKSLEATGLSLDSKDSQGRTEGRRRLFAQINSFIAIFILAGQLTLTGHILTVAWITVAICSAPVVAFSNFVAFFVWPTWVAFAVSENLRKICIDVQRLGDAAAAGMYKLLFQILDGKM